VWCRSLLIDVCSRGRVDVRAAVSSRVVGAFKITPNLHTQLRGAALQQVQRVASHPGLSANVAEVVGSVLKSAQQ
jgi:hypothetical protein